MGGCNTNSVWSHCQVYGFDSRVESAVFIPLPVPNRPWCACLLFDVLPPGCVGAPCHAQTVTCPASSATCSKARPSTHVTLTLAIGEAWWLTRTGKLSTTFASCVRSACPLDFTLPASPLPTPRPPPLPSLSFTAPLPPPLLPLPCPPLPLPLPSLIVRCTLSLSPSSIHSNVLSQRSVSASERESPTEASARLDWGIEDGFW